MSFNGVQVLKTKGAMRVLETSHPPTYYMPISDIDSTQAKLVPAGGGGSFCEWKGQAVYYDLVVGDKTSRRACWRYPNPTTKVNPAQAHGWSNYGSGTSEGTGGSFAPIADMVAIYAGRVDECTVAVTANTTVTATKTYASAR